MTNDRLAATSHIYTTNSDIYELFSHAEDSPKKIVSFLRPKLQNKIVLDFGCGTGKFIPDLSVIAKELIATDISESQINIARKKSKNLTNVKIIKTEENILPIPNKSIDVIFAAWIIGGVQDLELRSSIIQEFKKVLKPGGSIYLIENDINADFKYIIEGKKGNKKTETKLRWLRDNNFWEIKRFETHFEFDNIELARHVFKSIWGSKITNKIKQKIISHNVVILEYSPNIILDTTKYVVDNAQHVRINQPKLNDFIENFELHRETNWLKDLPFDIKSLTDEQKLMLAVVFNAISFSYWGEPYWNVEYKGVYYKRGSWSLMATIFRSIEEGESLLNPTVLSQITIKKLSKILRGNTEIPLLEERKEILNRVGRVLLEKYNGKFSKIIKEAKSDALVLLDIILNIFSPSFDDFYNYKGEVVYFNKRAQALVESIHSIYDGKGYGALKNTDSLTALADYIIPNMLKSIGVIEYSQELSNIIDNKQLIEKGSEYEIEIRASVIWVVEYIRRGLIEKDILVSSKTINDYLWTKGGTITTPFHQTRTTAY